LLALGIEARFNELRTGRIRDFAEGIVFMNEAEVDIVAEELAKLGGTAWYPGRERGPVLRVVHKRYRDRARAAIAALDRFRAQNGSATPSADPHDDQDESKAIPALPCVEDIQLGATIIYRPPGDQRAYPCTVKRILNGFAYLVPENRTGISWVPISELTGGEGADGFQAENDKGQERAQDR
jgi:hypothetical protein